MYSSALHTCTFMHRYTYVHGTRRQVGKAIKTYYAMQYTGTKVWHTVHHRTKYNTQKIQKKKINKN